MVARVLRKSPGYLDSSGLLTFSQIHVVYLAAVGADRARAMDIVVWLRSLGLGKYEAAFRENEIDETVLPNLTAEDLKDLGVGIVGHRRKLLDAIAALRNDGSVQNSAS